MNGRALWGTIVFSVEPVEVGTTAKQSASVLARARRGEIPALFLERREAGRGMSCNGFTDPARAALLEAAAERLRFARGFQAVQAPEVSSATLNGCAGLRMVGRSRDAEGGESVLDQYAVSDGATLYLFELRSDAAAYDERRRILETAVTTWKFAAGKGRGRQ